MLEPLELEEPEFPLFIVPEFPLLDVGVFTLGVLLLFEFIRVLFPRELLEFNVPLLFRCVVFPLSVEFLVLVLFRLVIVVLRLILEFREDVLRLLLPRLLLLAL